MRALIGFTVTIVVLVAIVLLVNSGLADRAERQISERATAELGAAAEVELGGFPVGLRLLLNRVPEAVLRADGVPIPGRNASLSSLEVRLEDARFSLQDLAAGADLPVRAEDATFRAELDGPALLALAGAPPLVQRIDLVNGEVQFVVGGAGGVGAAAVAAAVGVRGGDLVLRPLSELPPEAGGLDELVVPLQGLPGGAVVTDARVEAGRLVLTGSASDLLLAPEGSIQVSTLSPV